MITTLQDPVTWYGINYAGTQITQWYFQSKITLTSPARLSFVLEVPLRYLRPNVIYSVPCDRILQRAYFECDWLIELSDNKLSNNNLASEFVKNRSFFKQTTIEKIEILVIKNVTTFNSFKNEKMS